MKLERELSSLIKRTQRKQFEGTSYDHFLSASPKILSGITPAIFKILMKDEIHTIRDLMKYNIKPGIHPQLLALLLCKLRGLPSYDPGPPCDWEHTFRSIPFSRYQYFSSRFRLEFGPVFYRGRLNGSAKILVVGQDPSTDEILVQRAFVGMAGQRVQKYLNKLGITRSYIMLNTFAFGIYQQFDSEMRDIASDPEILTFRNKLFDKIKEENNLEAIISFGNGADYAIEHWPNRDGIPWFELTHPTAQNIHIVANWNNHLPLIHEVVTPDDTSLVDLSDYPANMANSEMAIPRRDLPFGIPTWHGTGGTRSNRDGSNTIRWNAP